MMIPDKNAVYWDDSKENIKLFPDKSVDCIITDFPYEQEFDLQEYIRICKGNIITFCSPSNIPFKAHETLFWIKTPSTKNNQKNCSNFVEMILVYRQGDTFNAGLHWSNYTGVYDDKLLNKSLHPFQKPISLMERLVSIYSNKGDLVFDPFAGSGVTLQAAYNLGRDYLGYEINKEYHTLCKENLYD